MGGQLGGEGRGSTGKRAGSADPVLGGLMICSVFFVRPREDCGGTLSHSECQAAKNTPGGKEYAYDDAMLIGKKQEPFLYP